MNPSTILSVSQLSLPWKTQDPYIFCSYHFDDFPGGNSELGPKASLEGRNIGQDFASKDGWNMYHGTKNPGFPAHPHAGFETVTIVTKGLVDHSDSLGGKGRFGDGDVQWLTSGKGVLHAEMFPLLNPDKNPFEIFQLWLNLPAKSKRVEPHYKMLWKEEIPVINHKDSEQKETTFHLIAGAIDGVKSLSPTPDSWAADPANNVQIWRAEVAPGASFTIEKEVAGITQSLYFYDGQELTVDGEDIPQSSVVELDPEQAKTIKNTSSETAYLFFLQGKRIGETVVQHGPFVANSKEGVRDMFYEYERTQFGGWPHESSGPVHGSEKGRFAKFTDGTEVVK